MYIEYLNRNQIEALTFKFGNELYKEVTSVDIVLCTQIQGYAKVVVKTETKNNGTYMDTYEMSDYACCRDTEVGEALTAVMQEYLTSTYGKVYERDLKEYEDTLNSFKSL